MRIYWTITCIFFMLFQIIPGMYYYQDYVYDKDKTEYDLAKTEHDSITIINRNNIIDSLTNAWISVNDTTLRKIKKIKKTPEYGELGYYQRTGRMECEENYRGKLICEPEKQWITTDYYISGYKKDTIWTEGYKTRDEWLKKANDFAKSEAIKIYPDFHEYNGHEFHYLIKSNVTSTGLGMLITFILIILIAIWYGFLFKFIGGYIEEQFNTLLAFFACCFVIIIPIGLTILIQIGLLKYIYPLVY